MTCGSKNCGLAIQKTLHSVFTVGSSSLSASICEVPVDACACTCACTVIGKNIEIFP